MIRKIVIGLITLIGICTALVLAVSTSKVKDLSNISIETDNKPIILIVVDSLMSEPLQKAVKDGKAPAFNYLMNNGHFNPEIISSYPTMSVTIDSTLLTGTYANEHHIPGLIWFKEDENRVISYGSGIKEIWNNGLGNVAMDSVVHLNQTHLSKEVKTIHEEIAERNLATASINGLVYRGSEEQLLHVPKLISMSKLLPKEIEVKAPKIMSLGVLSQYNPKNNRHKFVWKRMGLNNEFTANELLYLFEEKKIPAFTLAYLPDADASIHKKGPDELEGIVKADEALQTILNRFPSWEEAIQDATWIVLGDSGQSSVEANKTTSLIDLNQVLGDYSFWNADEKKGQLALGINERMAYIYVNDQQVELSAIVDILKKDKRIGFIAWKDDEKNYVVSPDSDREFTFTAGGPYVDAYYQSWQMDGDASILDLNMTKNGEIIYQDYPDALARLYGALHSQEGRVIIVDAKPSYEFIEKDSHDHAGGGAHGSLHQVDSLVPIIIAGTSEVPLSNRLVDIKEWILQLLDTT